jgi:HEAT repeat protein
MKTWILILASLLVGGELAYAHGGYYRAPTDQRFPPNKGGSRPPRTGGPGVPTGPTTDSVGGSLEWQFWWELHKASYLRLKDRIWSGDPLYGGGEFELGRGIAEARARLAPSEAERLQKAVPALVRLLEEKDASRDLVTACLIALGKADGGSGHCVPLLLPYLQQRDQEIRESTALALGLTGTPDAIDPLIALSQDSQAGRELLRRHAVDDRTRSFATYGLGLIAEQTRHPGQLRRIASTLRELLESPKVQSRADLQVAVVHAMRLFPLEEGRDVFARQRAELRDSLWRFLARRGLSRVVEAHAWPALARLTGRDGEAVDKLSKELLRRVNRSSPICQSAILALGEIGKHSDRRLLQTLHHAAREHSDRLARNFAWISLARLGGEQVQGWLMRALAEDSTRKFVRPWIALALAVHVRAHGDPHPKLNELLRRRFVESNRAADASGLGMALALLGVNEAGPQLLDALERFRSQDRAAGHLAVAVGLLGHRPATERLEEILRNSLRRPNLLSQSAVGLALLGGDGLSPLLRILRADENYPVSVFAALADAIGFVGERRSIDPLLAIAAEKQRPMLARAFAVAALGRVLSTRPLPWNSPIGIVTNYAATTETLLNGSTGILDIL